MRESVARGRFAGYAVAGVSVSLVTAIAVVLLLQNSGPLLCRVVVAAGFSVEAGGGPSPAVLATKPGVAQGGGSCETAGLRKNFSMFSHVGDFLRRRLPTARARDQATCGIFEWGIFPQTTRTRTWSGTGRQDRVASRPWSCLLVVV